MYIYSPLHSKFTLNYKVTSPNLSKQINELRKTVSKLMLELIKLKLIWCDVLNKAKPVCLHASTPRKIPGIFCNTLCENMAKLTKKQLTTAHAIVSVTLCLI